LTRVPESADHHREPGGTRDAREGREGRESGARRDPAVAVWRLLRRFQWRIVWLRQSKFVITVCGLVRDDAGRVLLLRHRYWPVGRQVGMPGGYAVAGERLEEAVAREVREETGLEVEVAHVVRVRSGYRLRLEVAYAATVKGGRWRLDPHEVISGAFYEPADAALPEDLMPDHRRLIRENADWFRPRPGLGRAGQAVRPEDGSADSAGSCSAST
jgi:8-oxo-dGTP diphosphatase